MVDLPNLVASAIENDRSNFSAAVLLSNNSRTVKRIREILPKRMRLVTLTSSSKVSDNLNELGFEVEVLEDSLSSQGLSVLNSLHDIILQGLGEGRFKSSDRILAIMGEPMDGVIVIEASNLASNKLAIMANEHDIDIEVLARLMELARHIGSRGREGHGVPVRAVARRGARDGAHRDGDVQGQGAGGGGEGVGRVGGGVPRPDLGAHRDGQHAGGV